MVVGGGLEKELTEVSAGNVCLEVDVGGGGGGGSPNSWNTWPTVSGSETWASSSDLFVYLPFSQFEENWEPAGLE